MVQSEKITNDNLLEIDNREPEADLPKDQVIGEKEISEIDFEKQKVELAKEWPNFSGVKMPEGFDFDRLSETDLLKLLYENLIAGVDLAIAEIGFEIDSELLSAINNEKNEQKKTELQKKFIEGVINQTRSIKEGGKLNRGKEDKWAFYPKRIAETKRVNCSGATLLIGRILEQAGLEVDHGMAAHHAMSVVKLADGHSYYVDSRRNRHNIVVLEDEVKSIGGYQYRELHHPQIAYEKIITVPKEIAEIEVIISNYNSMRRESEKTNSQDNEAKRQIGIMDRKVKNIDFGLLSDKLFPLRKKLRTEIKEWLEEEKRVDAKHNFSDQLDRVIGKKVGELTDEQKIILTDELNNNKDKIIKFCSQLDFSDVSLKKYLSQDAYSVVVIIRDTLESIRAQSQAAYEFALEELKGKLS